MWGVSSHVTSVSHDMSHGSYESNLEDARIANQMWWDVINAILSANSKILFYMILFHNKIKDWFEYMIVISPGTVLCDESRQPIDCNQTSYESFLSHDNACLWHRQNTAHTLQFCQAIAPIKGIGFKLQQSCKLENKSKLWKIRRHHRPCIWEL